MNILVFSEVFWPEGSGGELATYLICKTLAASESFNLTIVTGTLDPLKVHGAHTIVDPRLKTSSKVELFIKILLYFRSYKNLIEQSDLVYIPRFCYPFIPLSKKLKKKVIVHLHTYPAASYTATIFAEESQRPMNDIKRTLTVELASESLVRGITGAFLAPTTKLIRMWLGVADRIVCVSRRQAQITTQLAPEYEGKIEVVYNQSPYIQNITKELEKVPTFLFAGGDSYAKGFHIFLEASIKVLEQGHKVHFILTKDYSAKSIKTINRLNKRYANAYTLYGRITYEDFTRIHGRVWAMIFPSIFEEPLPYALMESMLLGTVPIASKVGGVMEIVDRTPAVEYTFSPYDVNGLSQKIIGIAILTPNEVLLKGDQIKRSFQLKSNCYDARQRLLNAFSI